MSWDVFIWFAAAAMILWTVGAACAWAGKRSSAIINYSLGIAVFFAFILAMWISLERPPLRT
ncbi:MAG: cytochrome C assembly protein, partial [Bacteroidales bacterium]|nr:cytochrome C assembly protein [Bacteroidales bacterium]